MIFNEVIKLGFKKEKCEDSVFYKQNGFEYFSVSLKISKKYSMDWDVKTHHINLYKYHNLIKENLTDYEVLEFIEILK